MFRIGFGMDSHRFTKNNKPLILAATEIEGPSIEAESDGDVILHALFNALSQAIGGRSLGHTSDRMCKQGITDSSEYVKVILKEIKEKGYIVNNIGIMIEAKEPRLDKYFDKMQNNLAKLLDIPNDAVGITITSGEGLTEFGKGNGIKAEVIASITK